MADRGVVTTNSALTYEDSEDFARALDAADPLREYRAMFHIPLAPDGKESVYLAGNSLGLQPKKAKQYIDEELEDWAKLGVEGHFAARHPWLPYHENLTDMTARLVGAKPIEVVVMNTLTVNLHLMMVSFYRPTRSRYKILIERNAFPSDQYAVASQAQFHGFNPADAIVELSPRNNELILRPDDILEFIDREGESIALVMLGNVNYLTGQAFDMEAITRAAHGRGCMVGFNLAHGAGNLKMALHDWDVDFAVWCSYKYLNAGPGSVAGCFVHERFARSFDLARFAGWWGHNKQTRFKMGPLFDPIEG
ncbi:MAG TPA: kynureninase, partial [Candidatus Obscuribacterales bacterium]